MPHRLLIAWAHLAVLWSFAFVKPLFDVLADSPEFFVARGNTSADILILALGLTLVPPTLLVAVELAVWRFEPVRRAVHLAFVGVLVAACALQVIKDVDASTAVLIGLAVLVGALVALAYARTRFAPAVLTVLAPAPLVFLLLLLVFSPVSKLVFPQGEDSVAQADVRGSTPIVFVVFDEFSVASLMDAEHRIDATRYPNFARLARDSTWYRGATTVADVTTRAVPAIVSGNGPVPKALPIAADYPRNLFTLLGDGYAQDVDESASKLCPTTLCRSDPSSAANRLDSLASDLSVVSLHLLLPKDLESDLPAVDQTFSDFGDGDGGRPSRRAQFLGGLGSILAGRGASFMRFVAGVKPDEGRPSLDFLHVQLPHLPWEYLPSGERYGVLRTMPFPGNDEWRGDPTLTRLGLQRYLLQLGYVDRLIGRLLDRLEDTGLYERSLVVVTADHGLAFQPTLPRRTLTRRTFAEIAGVPLFLKAPGQRSGRIVDAPVLSTDILPTMADDLGVRLPWRTEGRSLRRRASVDRSRLSVNSRDNPPGLTVGLGEYRRGLDAAVDRMILLFGSRDSGRGLYAVADRDLLGRRVDRLPAAPREGSKVEFATTPPLRSAGGRSARAPGFVEGLLHGPAKEGQRLAIAVDGRVRAVTYSYRAGDEVRIWAIVPPGVSGRGSHRVEVLAIRGRGADRRLGMIPAAVDDRLVSEDGRTVIVTSSGRRLEVEAGAVSGALDEVVSLAGRALIIRGWAGDTRADRPADRVLVFADGRLLADGAPTAARPDVAKAHGRGVLRSGFQLTAPTRSARKLADSPRLRVFAVSGRRASELEPTGEAVIVP